MNNKEAEELIEKYLNGSCSPEEKALFESWYNDSIDKRTDPLGEPDYVALQKRLASLLPAGRHRQRPLWPKIAVAASLLIAVGAGLIFHLNKNISQTTIYQNDVAAGGNQAILTLASGKRINLRDAKNGQLAQEPGIKITKTADGQLVYTIRHSDTEILQHASGFNTIETPNGGQYQVHLPDGTRVWLNAASSLKYPVNFALGKRRIVELSGEAYFEVAKINAPANKSKRIPFIVKTDKEKVEVLGTHFNIYSYKDESLAKTTLLEGSVRVTSHNMTRMLVPGEQAETAPENITVTNKVDLDEVLAWKNGKFVFENEGIESIMRKLSRWYDVEVIYKGEFKNKTFTGSISKFNTISKILDKITFTQAVHFKIEGRRITVMQ